MPLDHSLLKSEFTGRDGFVWWIGKVANPKSWRDESTDVEKGWSFRCKVRIIGYAPWTETELPDEDLPWAHVMVPATTGAGQACLGDSSRMVGGETVFGFFMDGEEGQQPVIFGALARPLGGPKNDKPGAGGTHSPSDGSSAKEIENAFKVTSGRDALATAGATTLPSSKKTNTSGTPKDNNDNKHGALEKDVNTNEGLRRDTKSSEAFANITLDPHSGTNGCENDAISKITHAIGSFLKTINALTEFAGTYVDAVNNLIADISRILNKTTRLIVGAIKWLVNELRDKIMKFLNKRFKDLVGLIVPEPQKSPIVQALKRIMDIVFCLFEKAGFDIMGWITGLLKDMIGKTINATVCSIEQAVAGILGKLNDTIMKLLKPILDGLDWLSGVASSIGGILGKVSSYINMIMSFLSCDSLQCKEYEDWSQGWGLSTKGAEKMSSVLDNIETINNLDGYAGDGNLSFLSMLAGDSGIDAFFDCNEKTNNPQSQDDIGNVIPPGFTYPKCIPPIAEVFGDSTKPAKLVPIVAEDGTILTVVIVDAGKGYKEAPRVQIIDKTKHGGGAIARTTINDKGQITSVYLVDGGVGYCPSTGVVPPKYPVSEPDEEQECTIDSDCPPGQICVGGKCVDPDAPVDEDDDTPPFITFTTPADNAVGVQTAVTITMTFNEPVVKGTGSISIFESSSGSLQEEIDVTRPQITFISDNVIAIDPSSDLKSNTEYYVKMTQGSFKDKAGNIFAGIGQTDTYNFTTKGVAGIGSQPVGIVTNIIPEKPGIGYTDGDTGDVGGCLFELVLTNAGSIVGIKNLSCNKKFSSTPIITINTNTGLGAQLVPVISYSPDFTRDIGEEPDQKLVVNVIDCV
tara:strand:+ start:114 stop:2684 length:2571 start_codon:yes stop_codon:yes gene_type:complete